MLLFLWPFPFITLGFSTWADWFFIYGMFTGVVLSIVFQLAHTVEETHFPQANAATGKMEDEWALHQLKTTANFATRNRVNFLVGRWIEFPGRTSSVSPGITCSLSCHQQNHQKSLPGFWHSLY